MAYKTARHHPHRIREAMGLCEAADAEPLTGTVEVDETYMGSKKYDKCRNRAKCDKEPVFGIWNSRKNPETFTYVVAALVIGTVLPHSNLIESVDEVVDGGAKWNWTGNRSSRWSS